MKPSPLISKIFTIMLTVVFITLPVAQAFADRHHNQRKSVRQFHKSNQRRPSHQRPRPPRYKPRPPQHKPRPPHYKPRPPRYRGRYHKSYRAWRLIAGVAAGIAIGTMLASPPPQAKTVVVQERTYYVHDNVYYEPVLDGGRVVYQVVPRP